MTTVLGYELQCAVDILTAEGYGLQLLEVRSRKGVDGNEKRVVRQQALPETPGVVRLTYAVFQTRPQEAK